MYEKEISDFIKSEKNKRRKERWIFIGIIIVLLLLVATVFLGIRIGKGLESTKEKKPEITSAFVSSKIEEVSDLTSAEMTYNGVIYYKEGDIPYITQKSYTMSYTAEVRAGIDMSEVKVTVAGDKVLVKVPEAEVQSIDVDAGSVNFYDESHALFNWDDKQDGVDAIKNAEADVEANADLEQLKKKATDNSKEIIYDILEEAVGAENLVVE